jgi:hypothetical protein
MAITTRSGQNTDPLELRAERTEWDRLPGLRTVVCAVGPDGWRYIGQIISTDEAARTYTIEVWTASNKVLDNARLYQSEAG